VSSNAGKLKKKKYKRNNSGIFAWHILSMFTSASHFKPAKTPPRVAEKKARDLFIAGQNRRDVSNIFPQNARARQHLSKTQRNKTTNVPASIKKARNELHKSGYTYMRETNLVDARNKFTSEVRQASKFVCSNRTGKKRKEKKENPQAKKGKRLGAKVTYQQTLAAQGEMVCIAIQASKNAYTVGQYRTKGTDGILHSLLGKGTSQQLLEDLKESCGIWATPLSNLLVELIAQKIGIVPTVSGEKSVPSPETVSREKWTPVDINTTPVLPPPLWTEVLTPKWAFKHSGTFLAEPGSSNTISLGRSPNHPSTVTSETDNIKWGHSSLVLNILEENDYFGNSIAPPASKRPKADISNDPLAPALERLQNAFDFAGIHLGPNRKAASDGFLEIVKDVCELLNSPNESSSGEVAVHKVLLRSHRSFEGLIVTFNRVLKPQYLLDLNDSSTKFNPSRNLEKSSVYSDVVTFWTSALKDILANHGGAPTNLPLLDCFPSDMSVVLAEKYKWNTTDILTRFSKRKSPTSPTAPLVFEKLIEKLKTDMIDIQTSSDIGKCAGLFTDQSYALLRAIVKDELPDDPKILNVVGDSTRHGRHLLPTFSTSLIVSVPGTSPQLLHKDDTYPYLNLTQVISSNPRAGALRTSFATGKFKPPTSLFGTLLVKPHTDSELTEKQKADLAYSKETSSWAHRYGNTIASLYTMNPTHLEKSFELNKKNTIPIEENLTIFSSSSLHRGPGNPSYTGPDVVRCTLFASLRLFHVVTLNGIRVFDSVLSTLACLDHGKEYLKGMPVGERIEIEKRRPYATRQRQTKKSTEGMKFLKLNDHQRTPTK